MKEGRFSTIRFNEWICISAQYEKAIARIGKQVYQGYSKGLVTDFTSIELCRDIAQTFKEARELREELEEELERDALDGLNAEEAAKADEVLELTQAQRTRRRLKLKFTKLMGRHSINRSLANHRDRVKELSRDLGQRALICFPEEPVLKVRGHKSLCRLANKLNDDADAKWQEITANKGAGGLSFHTILFGFVADFAKFSKGTHLGRILLKYFKYNEDQENQKLTQQYAGTNTAEALKAQMAEVDEPMLDVGREIDNMQQEYQENPDEWSSTGGDGWGDAKEDDAWGSTTTEEDWGVSSPPASAAPVADKFDFSPDSGDDNSWGIEAEEWVPEESVDDDFLNAVAAAPASTVQSPKAEPPSPTPAPSRATLIRKRPEPEAESWLESEAEQAAPSRPQLGSTPKLGLTAPDSTDSAGSDDSDDWGWGTEETAGSDFGNSLSGGLAGETLTGAPDPFKEAIAAESASADSTTEFRSKPSGKKPPFARSQDKPNDDWSQEPTEPQSPWGNPPPKQEEPQDSWGTPSLQQGAWDTPDPKPAEEQDFGWGSPPPAPKPPEPPKPPAPAAPPEPQTNDPTLDTMSIDVKKLVAQMQAEGNSDAADPLLRLLDPSSQGKPAKPADDLGDNLLPDFLRDRSDEGPDDSAFIPELPSFLESDDGPSLEIVPFGTQETRVGDDEDDSDEPFIPQMPDL